MKTMTTEQYNKYKTTCNLGKYDTELIMVDEKKVILSGTPMPDDNLFSGIAAQVVESFNDSLFSDTSGMLDDEDMELNSKLRDTITDVIMDNLGITIDYVYTEY